MLYTLLYIVLILMILNIMFSFVPIDSRVSGIIMILVIFVLLFGGPGDGRGRRFWCENDQLPETMVALMTAGVELPL